MIYFTFLYSNNLHEGLLSFYLQLGIRALGDVKHAFWGSGRGGEMQGHMTHRATEVEFHTGMDAFKALALGAAGVCIGRPLMTAIKQNPESGVRDYLLKARDELAKTMAYTGCADLHNMDPAIIRYDFLRR